MRGAAINSRNGGKCSLARRRSFYRKYRNTHIDKGRANIASNCKLAGRRERDNDKKPTFSSQFFLCYLSFPFGINWGENRSVPGEEG